MEILLGITIIAFIGFITYREKQFSEEKRQLIHALKSKDVEQFMVAEHVSEEKSTTPTEPEFVLEQDLEDEDFQKFVKETNEDMN